MSLAALDGLWWVLAFLIPFLLVQRWLHRELQAVFLLLTRRPEIALGLFSLLFFPGVLLHEASHYVAARLLRVPTGGISLLPQVLPDGRLRLGYVETARADPLREALIGTAPLLTGGAVIAFLGIQYLGFVPLAAQAAQGDWDGLWAGLQALPQLPDFWVWFYLAFAVSSTMMPSSSDRQAWLPVLLGVAVLLAVALLVGAGPWMLAQLGPRVNQALRAVSMVFGTGLVVHTLLVLPIGLFRRFLNRVTGLRVV
ncbi:MAG: hypothetical protein GYA17_12570 [Chloroflexi bacterium]|nr:hypothetical protein [Anaerolineaceae bacterium]NMB89185.1 hypothetical protein [Chloroflexota bacterium]